MDNELNCVYLCPDCGARVIWSLNNGRPGAVGVIKCANNMTASRMDCKSRKDFCYWNGAVVRQKDGSVKLFYQDRLRLLRPALRQSSGV